MRPFYVLGFLAFALLGALQAVYGPAFAALGERFGVGSGAIGLIASAHFLGTMLGVAGAGALLPRLGMRRLLRIGAALMAAGLAGVAALAAWPAALAAALVAGYGFGHVSVTFNVGGARLGERAAPVLNLLNACFGLGSILAPLLVAGLGGAFWPYAALGAASVALLLGAGRLPELPETTVRADGATSKRLVFLFGLLFFVYVGVEAGVGSWMTTHLDGAGVAGAAAWTSGFWLAVTLGRLLAPLVLARGVLLRRLVAYCALVAGAALLLAATPAAPVAYLVAGVAVGPIFATALAWFGTALPTRLAPIGLAAGSLGGAVFPWLLGRLAEGFGTGALPFGFAATSGLVLVMTLVLRGVLARRPAGG